MDLRGILSLGIAFLSLIEITPIRIQSWSFYTGQFHPKAYPPNGLPIETRLEGDVNNDGIMEQINFKDQRVVLLSSEKSVWQSPSTWRVVQTLITDLNRDGRPEMAMVVWRPFRPWFVDRYLPHKGRLDLFQDKEGQSCHFLLIGWKKGGYRELWASSALARPIVKFAVADLNRDGALELITLESHYDRPRQAQTISIWEWNGFGFSLATRIFGEFRELSVNIAQDKTYYLLSEK